MVCCVLLAFFFLHDAMLTPCYTAHPIMPSDDSPFKPHTPVQKVRCLRTG